MKIGIITFHSVHNFGAALQAMALLEWLMANGYPDAEIVDCRPAEIQKLYSLNPFFGGPRMSLNRLLRLPQRIKQAMQFAAFQRKHLRMSSRVSESGAGELLSRYDALICGSDQIWNSDITGGTDFYYAAQADSGVKKIAYAASFGKDRLNEFEEDCVKRYLPDFSAVSVRERAGAEPVAKILKQEVSVTVDPVFLHEAEYWKRLISDVKRETEDYILYYSLQNNAELISKTEALAREHGLKIIAVHPIAVKQRVRGKQLYDVDPVRFVSLIYNARYVCTNSFHAVAFSCIFGKKVIYEGHTKFIGRVESLLDMLDADRSGGMIDFSKTDGEKIDRLRGASEKFLFDALGD